MKYPKLSDLQKNLRKEVTSESIKILGIDASLRGTGWSLLDKGKVDEYGVIETKSLGSRGFSSLEWDSIHMHKSFLRINDLIEALHPDVIVVEIPHISQRASVAIQIGIVWGALSELICKQNCYCIDHSYLKTWSSSKRGDRKKRVEEKVRSRVLVDSNNDNIIDAIGICLMTHDYIKDHQR